MRLSKILLSVAVLCAAAASAQAQDEPAVQLPAGVRAEWDVSSATRETTPTRERICINGLWRWRPAAEAADQVPTGHWGYFKVPAPWPGITDYMQSDYQTLFPHPTWRNTRLAEVTAAWYQREITIPTNWADRRILLQADHVNSFATVYVDGTKAGEIRFPDGEVDLTGVARPGAMQVLTLCVVAMPLSGVRLSFSDTNSAKQARGSVARRGLCGDLFLAVTPPGVRLGNVRVDTSLRKGEVQFQTGVEGLAPGAAFTLAARITDRGRVLAELRSPPLHAPGNGDGRVGFSAKWQPAKLWDIHTPGNQYEVALTLLDGTGKVRDTSHSIRFGFREFWINGRDFYLNGTRLFLSALPLDNAEVGAALSTYEGARESLLRLKGIGINLVYTHNYGCEPGAHLSFTEILRACDDVGMLVSFSQPHFAQYDWTDANADRTNGYARDAAFYVNAAGSHPSVVFYSMSHNATGYNGDMDPDLIDGLARPHETWSDNNAKLALRAEAIVRAMDPARIVYHHSSGNLGAMHNMNFYTNFAPSQELDDWFEHWSARGVKPLFTCEYMVPCTWDWTMYRGWYKGSREFGSAVAPWEYCIAEWSAQFLGDRAYRISEAVKENLRWEARQFREGNLWHRWDYPHQVGDPVFSEQHEIIGRYLTDNWRAFRTWGVSATSPWEHHFFWKLRDGVEKRRKELPVDWARLQRPGYSPDYIERTYERMDLAYRRSDWFPTADGQAILRNNQPLLAYVAGKPTAFTSKDHNFVGGDSFHKQFIVINNSRRTVACSCRWKLDLPQPIAGTARVTVATGQQVRIPMPFTLPAGLAPGRYALSAAATFGTGETQKDTFAIDVLPRPAPPAIAARIALFDPRGETGKLLAALRVPYRLLDASSNLSGYDLLVVGKGALTTDRPAPDIRRARDGLRVLVFEQTSEALEKRLGFRVEEYGLRRAFIRVPRHPALSGLDAYHLRDWHGDATLLPPRLKADQDPMLGSVVQWCGLDVPHVWRCGNRGNVASVLIEKPAKGDFLPVVDGGYSLQYSPLLEYREGRGLVLFCQLDVTGRTETDPAATTLVRNLLAYVATWRPTPRRRALYVGGPTGARHLAHAGITAAPYQGGAIPLDQVLVVGAGSAGKPTPTASDIATFVRGGGHILALGLDEAGADALLPGTVKMTKAEHIAASFDPPAVGSPFAGIAPADLHNRDPRQVPLVTGGGDTLGDGIVAKARDVNVVYYQLPPYDVSRAEGALPSFAVTGTDAAGGRQCALLTLGSITGAGAQFGQKVAGGEVGKTYTFVVRAKAVGDPVSVHLEVERPARPWDRAIRAASVTIAADAWTEVYATFKVDRAFAEGWFAYLACNQAGARLRVDDFRLYEGGYVPGQLADGARNLFANPGFEEGAARWEFRFNEQENLRRTYRRASFALARLLANMGVSAATPLLERFSTPSTGPTRPSLVRNGDFAQEAGPKGAPVPWQFISEAGGADCEVESLAGTGPPRALRMTCPQPGAGKNGGAMLAQLDVPVEAGQWYRISFRAKASGFGGQPVNLALQDTVNWTALLEYRTFTPTETWEEFRFLLQAKGTGSRDTRFQIWHSQAGTLRLASVRLEPAEPPTTGRWLAGFYVDQPKEWDDPYRFFRW